MLTVEEVRFPAIFLADPDVSRSAVCIVVAVFAVIPLAVLVALGAHLMITTIDSFREVALDEVGVVQEFILRPYSVHEVFICCES